MPPRRNVKKVTRKPYKKPTKKFRRAKYRTTNRKQKIYGPFPLVMNTQLLYKNPSGFISSSGISSINTQIFRCNSLVDYDQSNNLGNKQPLFYDSICTTTGPYQNYRVNAWSTKLTIINLSDKPLNVYYDPCSFATTEADSEIEMQNRRQVQYRMLTAQSNARPSTTFKSFVRVKDFCPDIISSSENYSSDSLNNPSKILFSQLLWSPVDTSIAIFNVALQVETIFYVTFFNADSIAS